MNEHLPPNSLPAIPPAGGELALAGYGSAYGGVEDEESAIRRYWHLLYRWRVVILAIAAAGLLIGLLVSLLTRPQYAGTAMVEVSRDEAKVINMGGVSEDNGESRFDPEFYQTQYTLLKSRSLSERVVQSLNLAENYAFLGDFAGSGTAKAQHLPRDVRYALATKKVNESTVITPIRMSSIINVTYQSPDPQMAATIANSIVEDFIQANLLRRYEAAA